MPDQEIAVTMTYGQWMYFLGWLEHARQESESIQMTDTIALIAQTMRDG